MNIWTSSARWILACLLLSGCLGAAPEIRVAGGAVAVRGPEGYCIDRRAMQKSADGDFVLLAGCHALARGSDQPSPDVKAVLTATIGPAADGASGPVDLAALEDYVRSDAGRAALSRDSDASAVSIRSTRREDDVLFVYVTDPGGGDALTPAYWRAFLDLNNRIISLSAYGTIDQPIGRDAGLALLREFIARLRQANPKV